MKKLELLQALERREISVSQAKSLLAELRRQESAAAAVSLDLLTLSRHRHRLELEAVAGSPSTILIADLSADALAPMPIAGVQRTLTPAGPAALSEQERAQLADSDAVLLLLGADSVEECHSKLQSAFLWIRALRYTGRRVLLACHGRLHAVLSQGIAGIAQVVRTEHPDWAVTVAHTESGDLESATSALQTLARSDTGAHFELMLAERIVYASVLIENRQPAEVSTTGWRQRGVYLISGGGSGIGLQIARYLRQNHDARVVLAGRRTLDEPLRGALDAALGVYDYVAADVANEAQVARLMTEVRARHGGLHGLIHAAGVLDDSFFIRQDVTRFASVLAPKLLGTHFLDAHSRDFDLDFFAVCSSMATYLPNTGQAAYAAANRAMSALAALRRDAAAPGRTLCLHWPLWDGGRMGLSPHEKTRQAEAFGIHPMPAATGLLTLDQLLASDETDRWYLHGERTPLERLLAGVTTPAMPAAPLPAPGDVDASGLAEITGFLAQAIAQATEIAPAKIHPDQTFDVYGLDSLMINRLNQMLADRYPGVAQTVFFEYPSIRALARYLSTRPRLIPAPPTTIGAAAEVLVQEPAHAAPRSDEQTSAQCGDIAIIGVAGRYPGAADIDALAARLRAGDDCISEIPASRWPLVDFRTDRPDSASLTAGGYIDDVEMFDPYFFGISPRDAENIDPQERLFLQTAWHALEHGGYSIDKLHRRSRRLDVLGQPRHCVGVYVGMAAGQYSLLVARHHQPDGAVCAQSSSWSVANRVSYFLDLHGPSLSVDTACSSSLSALEMACSALRNDDIAMAIVGGVSLNLDPLRNRVLEAAHMLSSDRRCRSFGAGGNGFVPGEGVAAVLLRRLGDAERDGDTVLGVIKACRLNHGGRTNGYTVPSPVAHANVIAEALHGAGVSAADIGYVEAHGTGTQLGDPIELAGLVKAFAADTQAPCAIGSIKSNIGHLEPAAALAGLTKILLQFDSATIFPSLHSRVLNPALDIDQTPFVVPQAATAWTATADGRRVAALSSFGAGGSNGHLIVERRDRVAGGQASSGAAVRSTQLFCFSAMTRARLDELAQIYIDWLQAETAADRLPPPATLAELLRTTRSALDCRLAIIARDYDELVAALDDFLAHKRPDAWRYRCVSESPAVAQVPLLTAQVAELLQQGAWPELAERWLANPPLAWPDAQPSPQSSRRITLPLYPFERRRCWFHDRTAPPQARAAEAADVDVYPFSHIIDRDVAGTARITFRLDPADPMLAEHKVNGRIVVAGTLQLELVRAAAALAGYLAVGSPLCFLDVIFAGVLTVEQTADVAIMLTPGGHGRFAFEVATGGVHSRGMIAAAAAAAAHAIPAGTDDAPPMAGDALYRLFAQAGYAYGELYRGIESAMFGADRCSARLRPSDPATYAAGRYAPLWFHPAIVDAGLQSIAVLNARTEQQYLPFSCREIRLQRPAAEIVRSVAVRRPSSRDGEQRFDIHLLDRHDRECVAYLDFCCRVLVAEGHPSPVRATNLYRPLWKSHVPSPAARATPAACLTLVLAAARESPLVTALVDALGEGNVQCLDVSDAAGRSRLEQYLRERDGQSLRLFHCVAVADGAGTDSGSAGARDPLDRSALYTLFDLSQALLSLKDVAIELTIVTDNVFQLDADTIFNLAGSSLPGFAKSLSREFTGAKVALVDFSAADIVVRSAAERRDYLRKWLDMDLPSLPQSAIAIRKDAAYIESFAPVAPADVARSDALKRGGTYLIVGGSGGLGSATAEFLAEQYSATVILVGRRPASREFLALPETGAGRILHYRADITSAKDVQRLARDMQTDYGRIDGIFHSAIILRDTSVRLMSREALDEVLAPKTTGIVNLFTHLAPLCNDLIVLYSSAISQNGTEGQANYAAASTFEDTYARAMARAYAQRSDAPKVVLINWGFWREVGVVATRRYVSAFARKGVGGLSTAEGMALLRLAVNGELVQVVTGSDDVLTAADEPAAPPPAHSAFNTALAKFWKELDIHNIDLGTGAGVRDEMQACVNELLLVTLRDAGLFPERRTVWPLAGLIRRLGIVTQYEPLLHACIAILIEAGSLESSDAGVGLSAKPVAVRAATESRIARLAQAHADTAPILTLFRRCMDHLVAVMSGKMRYAEVMFPKGSDHLVAPLYRDNPASDLFNRTILRAVEVCLSNHAVSRPGRPLRILEIGAGTGGTTRWLMDTLNRHGSAVEYVFTDISSSFVNAARERFGQSGAPLSFAVLDIEDAASAQRLRGQFDILIATNVLHATRRIAPVLEHCRALLCDGGVLMVNEACERKDIMTLTFGLSSGWWMFEDAEHRIAHSPLLKPQQWSQLLGDRGFVDMQFIGDSPQTDAFGHFVCFAWAGQASAGSGEEDAGRNRREPAAAAAGEAVGSAGDYPAPLIAPMADLIRRHLSELQKIPLEELGDHVPFDRYGVDSIVALQLLDRLRTHSPALSNDAVIQHNTIASLAQAMASSEGDREAHTPPQDPVLTGTPPPPDAAPPHRALSAVPREVRTADVPDREAARHSTGDVAIVGISGRYPGAPDIDTFWAGLVAGRASFSPAPTGRWPATAPLSAAMQLGGYLEGIDHFDSLFFHVSPRDAQRMDPQERLLIEACWSALENAGYTPAALNRASESRGGVGVFAATMYGHYELSAADEWARNQPASASSAYYALANNVSRLMDFTGPSITVDSACSSALSALHLAMLHLHSGDCAAAIIAGVNLVLHPSHLASLDAMKMLSPRGECRVFAADADGFLVGEGVGAMVIKPLAAAQAQGDHIYAVVKATAANANGATATAVPSATAQANVVQRALDKAALPPDGIDYVELQSTGSRLGDKAEIDALSHVFATPGVPRASPLLVGSVKPNIGHLEAAAGMAQLTKSVLQLHHRVLAKTLADHPLRGDLDLAGAGIRLVRDTQSWPAHPARPRRAGISSFGAGGSNVHVIVEEYPPRADALAPRGVLVFPLSARKSAILRRYADSMARHFADRPDLPAAKVAFTAQLGRVEQRFRLCIEFAGLDDLRAQLAEFARGGAIRTGASGEVQDGAARIHAAASGHPPMSLAERWVRGEAVDWAALYTDGHPGRVVLPGYPFERVSHWFDRATSIQPTSVQLTGDNESRDSVGAEITMNSVVTAPRTAVNDHAITLAEIETLVAAQIGEVLNIDRSEIHLESPLSEYGFDSITLTELVARFAEPYGIDIDVTVFFEHTSVQQFALFLFEQHADKIARRRAPAGSAQTPAPGESRELACLLTEDDVLRIAAQSRPAPRPVATAQGPAAPTLEAIQALVVREVCSVLKIDAAELRIDDPLSEYGFDSITLSELVTRFSEPYGIDIDVTIFFEHTSLASFARYLFDHHLGRLVGVSATKPATIAAVAVDPPRETTPVGATVAAAPSVADVEDAPSRGTAIAARDAGAGTPAAAAPGHGVDAVREFLAEQVSDILRIDRSEVRMDVPLREFGFDAISSSELVRRACARYGVDLDIRAFISHPSLGSFAQHLFELRAAAPRDRAETHSPGRTVEAIAAPVQAPAATLPQTTSVTVREKDVAIIGMAGQFPGSVDLESFWQNLCDGRTAISGFPQRRTDDFTLYAARQAYPQFDHFFRAGFLDDFDKFDPLFFKISPVEARTIDPQQRLLLECAWQTIEDAGYNPRSLAGTLTGVFVGVATSEYGDILTLLAKDDQARDFTGTLFSAHANRISFNLDLHGPSEAIDTACSSSLVAVHRAVQALRTGECELALAGGANIILGCAAFLMFGAAGMLAKDGRCKSFDDKADGYVRGEGVGLVLLKSLSKAIEDGDNIRAVIKGTAIRHGGRAASMTSPGVVSQANLIRQSLDDAQLSNDAIGYIEAHGTGTRIGDPIEINALRRVFTDASAAPCAIGTVKANIGHLETAAGIAGLIKTILILERGVIPPLATLDTVNAMIKLEDSRLYLAREKQAWQPGAAVPRTAGVSSFGIGGVIVHQVLQQGSFFARKDPERRRTASYPVMLSAQSDAQLKRYCAALLKRINSDETLELHDLALTLARGREVFAHRVAMLATSRSQLISQLIGFVTGDPTGNVFSGHVEQASRATDAGGPSVDGDMRAAAERWANGHPVSWDALFAGMDYRKVSLPGYPFERESVWIAGRVILVTEEQAAARRAERVSPPAAVGTTERPPAPLPGDAANATPGVASPDAAMAEVMRTVLENLTNVLSETMHIPIEKLNPSSQFTDFGVDSLSGLRIMQRLQQDYGNDLPAAAVLENPTLLDLARFISESIVQGGSTVATAPEPAERPTARAAAAAPAPAPENPRREAAPSVVAKPVPRSSVSLLEMKPGQGRHPLVVLCAASGDLTWAMHWIDPLSDRQRVIGIELGGFGGMNDSGDAAAAGPESLGALVRDCAELLRDVDCGDGFRLAAYAGMAAAAAQLCDLPVVGNRLHEVILIDPQPAPDSADIGPLVQMYACAWGGEALADADLRPLGAQARAGAGHGELAAAIAASLTRQSRPPMPANVLNNWLARAVGYWNRLGSLLTAAGAKPAPYAGAMTLIESAGHSSGYIAQAWPNAETTRRQIAVERHRLVSRAAAMHVPASIAVAPGIDSQPRHPGLLTLNAAGRYENIICFPTLYGDPGYATSLSMHLGRDYSMFALEQWRGARPLTYPTIEALAGAFVEQLLTSKAEAPYTLLGLSFGGVVAYEVCNQLQRAGQPVANLVLIDPYMPNTDAFSVFGEMRLEVDGKDLNQIGLAGIIFDRWRVSRVLDFERLNHLPEDEQIELMARHLAAYSAAKLSFSAARRVIASHFAVDKANRRANTLYHPSALSADVNTLMIMASQGFYNPAVYEGQRTAHHYEAKEEQIVGLSSDPTKGFRPFLRGEFRLQEFACDHLSMPMHLRECAATIERFLGDMRGAAGARHASHSARGTQGVVYEI